MISERKRAYNCEYRRTHKEQRKVHDYKYIHSEKGQRRRREHRIEHNEEIKMQSRPRKKKFYKLHRDEMIAKAKAYQKTPEGRAIAAVCHSRYRSRIKGGDLTKARWMEIRDRSPICNACGRFVECENLSMDHIIPVSKGGLHTASNIQALCLICNIKKGAIVPVI